MNRKLNVLLTVLLTTILLMLAFYNILLTLPLIVEQLRSRSKTKPPDLSALPPPLPAANEDTARLLGQLRKTYGEKLYSQFDEETLIRHFFKDVREGFFVDVGAGDYQANSTTFYLEQHLGWKGIAIDANRARRTSYAQHRPQTKFFHFFVADKSDEETDLFMPLGRLDSASGDRKLVLAADPYEDAPSKIVKIKVRTITLNRLLDLLQIKTIDFLSMDIEGGEVAALAGFDIKRFKPKLVCIEVNHSSHGVIEDYFKRNDYKRIEEYVPLDPVNWYFTPTHVQTTVEKFDGGRSNSAAPAGNEGTSGP